MAFGLMLTASIETFHQATRTLSQPALGQSVTRGADVLRSMQQTLAMSQLPTKVSDAESLGLDRLAQAFSPMLAGQPRGLVSHNRSAATSSGQSGVMLDGQRNGGAMPAGGVDAQANLKLKMVMVVSGEHTALIDGPQGSQTVRAGDWIGEERVAMIGVNRVLLRGPDGERELRFEDALQ